MSPPPSSQAAAASTSAPVWWAGLATLVLATVAAFWPGLAGGFVWDDYSNLVSNTALREDGALAWAFGALHAGHWHPLTWVSFLADQALWGPGARGHHVTNLLLHVLNVLLFTLLARRLLSVAQERRPAALGEGSCTLAALLAGAIFALHPMRVESVVWITERRDVLCGTFCLAATLAFVRGARGATAAFFVAALLSKATAIMLPVVLLVLAGWPLRRLTAPRRRETIAALAPLFVGSLVVGLVALAAQHDTGALVSARDHGLAARLAQSAYGSLYYLRSMFAATAWYPLHEREVPLDAGELRFVLSGVVALAVTVLAWVRRRRWPALLVCWLIHLALLFPVLGLAQSGFQLAADRYGYLACLPWAVLAGFGLASGLERWRSRPLRRALLLALTAAVLVSWLLASRSLSVVWRSDATLWAHNRAAGPSAMTSHNLGFLAHRRGEQEQALRLLTEALRLKPTYAKPLNTLSQLLFPLEQGLPPEDVQAALTVARTVVERRPDSADAHFVLGSLAALSAEARGEDGWREAAEHLRRCTELRPEYGQAWAKWGYVAYRRGDLEAADRQLARALQLDPAGAGEIGLILGVVRIEQQRWGPAREALARAVEAAPDNSRAWTGLATAKLQLGEPPEQVLADLRRAVELDPANGRARALLRSLGAEP